MHLTVIRLIVKHDKSDLIVCFFRTARWNRFQNLRVRPKSANRPPAAAGSRFHKAKRTRIDPQAPYHCASRKCNHLNISHLAIFIAHSDFPPTTIDRKLSEDRQSMTVPSISVRQSSPVNQQTNGSGHAILGLTSASSDTPRQYPSPLPADWPPLRILSEATCRLGASDHGQAY